MPSIWTVESENKVPGKSAEKWKSWRCHPGKLLVSTFLWLPCTLTGFGDHQMNCYFRCDDKTWWQIKVKIVVNLYSQMFLFSFIWKLQRCICYAQFAGYYTMTIRKNKKLMLKGLTLTTSRLAANAGCAIGPLSSPLQPQYFTALINSQTHIDFS